MNIAIRADASINIGSGHVMRCMTLANVLKKNNNRVIFFCRMNEGNLISFIEKQGFEVVPMLKGNINSSANFNTWLGASEEIDAREFIESSLQYDVKNFDIVICDNYGISEVWEKIVCDITKLLIVIDDLANRPHNCDVLLDQNFFKNYKSRYDALVNEGCCKLLGPDFALLREEFAENYKHFPDFEHRYKNKIITLFFGGTDPSNYTECALIGLLENLDDSYKINVIVGQSNPNVERLKAYQCSYSQVKIYIQVSNMAEHIGHSILFVGAIGSTTWERCFCGTPALVASIAKNQEEAALDLNEISVHYYLGEASNLAANDYGKHALALLSNKKKLMLQHKNAKALVPGSGTNLFLTALYSFMESQKYVEN